MFLDVSRRTFVNTNSILKTNGHFRQVREKYSEKLKVGLGYVRLENSFNLEAFYRTTCNHHVLNVKMGKGKLYWQARRALIRQAVKILIVTLEKLTWAFRTRVILIICWKMMFSHALQSIWKILVSRCAKLVETLPKRFHVVIAMKGDSTKYDLQEAEYKWHTLVL